MVFNADEVKNQASSDFRKAWLETARLIPQTSTIDYTGGTGKPHPLHELIQTVRTVFLQLGFSEVENQVFIQEEDVYKQYGPEAPVLLDRVYYLAGLPRPDIGLSSEKKKEIGGLAPGFNFKKFQKLLRDYRAGNVEGDNFLEEMTGRLEIKTDEAAQIISMFPEFKNIQPVASKQTLRSHMTGAWFPTLAAICGEYEHPIKLFSIGMRYRREQKVDATHLRAHYGASMVILGDDVSLEAGKALTQQILEKLDFGDVKYVKKQATSNYYAPDTEYEVYSGKIEVADIGMYSPVALANYDIPYHVFNLGFGLERILMVKEGHKDVRELLYPQLYSSKTFTDKELAKQISFTQKPGTPGGEKLAQAILEVALKNADARSPCEFPAFDGELSGKKVRVSVVEKEDGTQLLGPAAQNQIILYDGNIYGIPQDTSNLKHDVTDILEHGVNTGVTLIEATANLFAAEIERHVSQGERQGILSVKMVKTPAEANITVSSQARKFITSQNKKIMIKGPVFTATKYEVE